jgi:hippurate hydrolase
MNLENQLNNILNEVIQWRHQIHSRPELAFEEYETSKFIQQKLQEWEVPYDFPLAGTGIVAKLEVNNPKRRLAFRTEMDALPIQEMSQKPYRSIYEGKMHACGHDGHLAALLGSVKIINELYKNNLLKNSIFFIFQPAEENEGGAKRMIEEGFATRYNFDAIYAIHNWPELPQGIFGLKSGPIMASYDRFLIRFFSKGAHAAMPVSYTHLTLPTKA